MILRSRPLLAGLLCLLPLAAVALVLALPRDGAARSDRWQALRGAPLERTEVAAARVGRFVYVVGGFAAPGGATTAAVERYDIRRNRWKRVRDMPVALNHPAAVTHGAHVYVHGGYASATGLEAPVASLLRYDPVRDRWRELRPSRTPRAAHAIAAIGARLFVAGGAIDSGSLRSLEIYDTRTRRWSSGPSFPGPARNHTTGVASGGRFYVLAGRDAGNLSAAERYDPRMRTWKRLPPLRTARGGIASARLIDGRIAVFGGERLGPGGTTIAQVELFDPRSRRWRSLPDLRTPRHGLGGVARGRRLYAIEFLDVPPRR